MDELDELLMVFDELDESSELLALELDLNGMDGMVPPAAKVNPFAASVF